MVGAVLAVAGIAMQAIGNQNAARASAAQARRNKHIQGRMAEDAINRGADDVQTYRTRVRQMLGTQRAGFAGQGIEVDSGSPLAVAQDTQAQAQLDENRIRLNAMREAWGYKQAGAQYRTQANLATTQGNFAVGETLLTGGAQLARSLSSAA